MVLFLLWWDTGGVLDLTLNKFRMELQGLWGGGGRSSMASKNEYKACFMNLFMYSLYVPGHIKGTVKGDQEGFKGNLF